MTILLFAGCLPSIGNGIFRTMVEARKTHRAMMQPDGAVILDVDIADRAGALAQGAPAAFFVCGKRPVVNQKALEEAVAGRDLTWTELYELRRSVLISENFAREVWGTPQAALGWRI